MGLTKRGRGWYVEFPVYIDGGVFKMAPYGRRSESGVKIKRWKAGKYKEQAITLEANKRVELEGAGIPRKALLAPLTFAAWAKQYIEIEGVKALRSSRERCQRIEKVLLPLFGKKLLKDIEVKDVEQLRNQRTAQGRALSTVNIDHMILRHMLKQAMKRGHLEKNVASLVTEPDPKNARNRVLEPEEWTQFYNAAPEWFKPVLLVGYHTGMRLEEILTLVWDRESRIAGYVDLEKGRVYLPASITKTKQARTVPLSPTVRSVLHDMKQAGGITRISGLVFTKDGKKLDHTYRVVQDICREVGIENFRFHDLRHSAVTNLRAAGVDVETIMKIVGHSSVEMFLRYRAVDDEELDAAMQKLEARQAYAPTPIQHHSRGQAAISS